MVSIQSSYTYPTKCKCSPPSRNLVSCSLLTSYFYSFSYLSYGDVIYGTSSLYSLSCPSYGNVICNTSSLCSFNCSSYGDVICGTFIVCLVTCSTICTSRTIVGITYGSTLPFIIFCALTFMVFCSLFTHKLEALPSSTLFFLLRKLLGEFTIALFLYSSDVYISLVLLPLADGFYGFSF